MSTSSFHIGSKVFWQSLVNFENRLRFHYREFKYGNLFETQCNNNNNSNTITTAVTIIHRQYFAILLQMIDDHTDRCIISKFQANQLLGSGIMEALYACQIKKFSFFLSHFGRVGPNVPKVFRQMSHLSSRLWVKFPKDILGYYMKNVLSHIPEQTF